MTRVSMLACVRQAITRRRHQVGAKTSAGRVGALEASMFEQMEQERLGEIRSRLGPRS